MYTLIDGGGLDSQGEPQIKDRDGKKISWKEARSRGFDKSLLEYQGSERSPFYGGAGSTIHYKSFELGVFFNYKFGAKMRAPRGSSSFLYNLHNMIPHKIIADRWEKPGDEATTNVPAYKGFYNTDQADYWDYYRFSDINVLDASYIQLKNLHFDYKLPVPLASKIGLKSLTLRFQARNLWEWTANDQGIDPRANDFGNLRLPESRIFVFGIKTKL